MLIRYTLACLTEAGWDETVAQSWLESWKPLYLSLVANQKRNCHRALEAVMMVSGEYPPLWMWSTDNEGASHAD